MSRIKEYIENLDKKNFIILILSIFIIFGGIGYYLNNFFSKEQNKIFQKRVKLEKKIRETILLNNKLAKIKKKNKLLKTKYYNLHNDLTYLLSEIDSSNVLRIKKTKFLKILHKYVEAGAIVNASFIINQLNKLNKYNLNIKGKFLPHKFFNFAFFIKVIEEPKAIITINNFNAFKLKNSIFYDLNVTIWSFK